MLRAEHLQKVFQVPGRPPVVAVEDATFEVGDGEIFGLLGPNGAGKTTLLRMLATIIAPTSGRCWIGGVEAASAPDAVRRHVGFLSGNTRLYGRLTGRETLRYFGRLYGMTDNAIARRTEELSDALDMSSFIDRRCDALSTGQTQKVSIARVILHDPDTLILDEPTLGLDIMSSRAILEFVIDARERNHTIILSTHEMSEVELLCDRVGLIHRGELMALGTIAELCASSGTENIHDAFLAMVDAREAAAP